MTGQRALPVLSHVRLQNLSLYTNRRTIDISIKPGVFCLAGANGLGKSTFLTAINFGLTGIVARPNRTFRHVDSYYEDCLGFSRRYFDGRVRQEDRGEAVVGLIFRVRNKTYSISRNLFEPQALREFTISDEHGQTILDTSDQDSLARHVTYKNRIIEDCNLGSFEYYVFLQHYILTFDERRHLLFWDQRAANVALYIAFGVAPDDTIRAEKLRLDIEREESNARNAQWQATIAYNSLSRLAAKDTPGLQELREQHKRLIERADSAREEADLAEMSAADAVLKASEASARQLSLRREYDSIFERRLTGQRDPARHPVVRLTLSEEVCDICGTASHEAIAVVVAALDEHRCPLCQTVVTSASGEVDFEELERIDDALAEAKAQVDAAHARLERLEREAVEYSTQAARAADSLTAFEQSQSADLSEIMSATEDLQRRRRELEAERRNAVARRDEHRRVRDQYREELDPLQRRLSAAYEKGESKFVPNFRRLARRFLGLDLDVYLDHNQGSFGLSVEVQGERRRTTTSLSESQRFFIEIALRMALSQHMSIAESPAGLLIDTPEGSLDIAYEAKAGAMFADFVQDGFNITMTANINSSQLLKRLARKCGTANMELARMTEWTALSEVQAEEEQLFNDAYSEIEHELTAGDTEILVEE